MRGSPQRFHSHAAKLPGPEPCREKQGCRLAGARCLEFRCVYGIAQGYQHRGRSLVQIFGSRVVALLATPGLLWTHAGP